MFQDVPPYNQFAPAISEVGRLGAMTGTAGQQSYFSPDSVATEADLIQGIRTLAGKSATGSKSDEEFLDKWNKQVPLLKGSAALILYWYGTQQTSWHPNMH